MLQLAGALLGTVSATLAPKEKRQVPGPGQVVAVGVPVIAPVEEFRAKSGEPFVGSDPEAIEYV
jgi:hypothetical protein